MKERSAASAWLGWYWAADVIAECGAHLHLAHPLGIKAFAYQRVKKDESDAALLADLLRMGRLPEAWVAPPEWRELREAVRFRHKLVEARANAKAQVHGVLAKQGVKVPVSDLFGVAGNTLLDTVALDDMYLVRVESLRDLVALYNREITMLDGLIARRLEGHKGYEAIQAIPGVGKILAAIFVAEIGDISRFERPEQLASWAGMTPRHHESDTTMRRGLRVNARAATLDAHLGFVQLVVDVDTDAVVGAHIAGPHASELIAAGVLASEMGAAPGDLARTVHAHPTLAESFHEAACRYATQRS